MLSDRMTTAVKEVTDAIRESEESGDYARQKKTAASIPGAGDLIERARDIQERLMNMSDEERSSDYAESLQDEYEEITENSTVYEYLNAELVYITMIQEIVASIMESVDI